MPFFESELNRSQDPLHNTFLVNTATDGQTLPAFISPAMFQMFAGEKKYSIQKGNMAQQQANPVAF